ncbi:YbhB/YbcL family Raf kinase inhibitor-like protein [Mycoplasmoides alvi]|uniref:YbhB/YbcL family Raf kinase inhibitor-like protein n=1 Tax=Mycoplasmoides alvi TaxID=78580 RepID=UPI00051ADCBB|nr:YbhB/YbcL family Raf kinase inhibitor-like protein [Mycoplasmoides alvi]
MNKFKVTIPHVDNDNFLFDDYGGNAKKEILIDGLSHLSPEISWDPVEGAKSYALECIDYDSASACGLIFVHWVVANIHTTKLELNASLKNKDILQGVNSCTNGIYKNFDLVDDEKYISNLKNSLYVGPCPPNSDHFYTFTIYALDIENLNLKQPFFIGDLHDKMNSHIISQSQIRVKYKQVLKKFK